MITNGMDILQYHTDADLKRLYMDAEQRVQSALNAGFVPNGVVDPRDELQAILNEFTRRQLMRVA